ncbi:TrkH family potassium uptake protein [Lentilactobacillus laojiaonis]|uniref:TrkH family potassium uptake protein n=1 Tax=Lentilactobacillus laojiaonis TaxID=2883998 RepID=UPI001D0AFF89|nr:TrkH family potassium uptake protein [Lentilactobacillus laojiaonis]UDM32258.1 TrkH family potassium uptake protein [Lentilactobacillus laojiaonis]
MVHKKFHLTLSQTLSLGFVIIILIGSLLLSLPIASNTHSSTNFLDALFTATSATCVTGLTVVNTVTHWSLFGKIIILLLVEIGGLGFMTFAVLLFNIVRRKVDLTSQLLVRESLSLSYTGNINQIVFLVVRLSLIIQIFGAGLIAIDFIPRFGILKGIGFSIFHAISAFCNAGFDLFDNSLVNFQTDPYLLFVISLLIISGSLGFIVWKDLLFYRQTHRLSLHTKLALSTYLGFIVIGFFILLLTERNFAENQSLTIFQRLVNTYFMAVTPRTAGFYTLPYSKISLGGLFISMVLMLIGGTPGSTAGGIKSTTIGILVAKVWSTIRGKEDVTMFHRRFSEDNVSRSLTVVFLVSMVMVVATLLLFITESVPTKFGLEYVMFEVVSAFGTSGLTLGLTPNLSVIGKIIIMLLMFIGRVGIFTVMFSLLNTNKSKSAYRYPQENVLIG